MLEYKGYTGHVEFDAQAGIFHGEVLDTRDVITFQGRSVKELQKAFRDSIEDYVEFCAERGEEPDKPFSGRLMVRLSPQLHRRLYVQAQEQGKSLNQLIAEKLDAAKEMQQPTRSKGKRV
jgi:predicted HicB family RNase H-like nuclease